MNINGTFSYYPQGQLEAHGGVGKCSPEALASWVLRLWTWILGILFNILALWKNIIGSFWYHPQGQLQAHGGVGKCCPEALASRVLKLLSWIWGILVSILALRKKHYGYFLIAPSGQASGPRRCWKLQSWGPGIQNFAAVNMNLRYFVQHTGCMKNIIGTFWYQPQGKLQPHGGVGKCRPEAQASKVLKL